MWNPDDYLDSLYHKAKVKFNYNSGNEKEWHRYAQNSRRRLWKV